MSGDVQPRKRKDKKKKRDDESSHGVHITKMGTEDVHLHVHEEHATGGHWCAKIIFFSLMTILLGLVCLIIMENRGISDMDTPLSESRFSNYFDGWVDEHRADDHHDDAHGSLEDHDEDDHDDHGDEPFEEEEDVSEGDEADHDNDEDEDEDEDENVTQEEAEEADHDDNITAEDNDDNNVTAEDEDNDDDNDNVTAEEDDEENVTAEEEEEENVTAEDDNATAEDENLTAENNDDEDDNVTVEATTENTYDEDEDEDDEDDDADEENDNTTKEDDNIDENTTREASQPTSKADDDDEEDDDVFDEDEDGNTFESVEKIIVDNDAAELELLKEKARQQAAAEALKNPTTVENNEIEAETAEQVSPWASSQIKPKTVGGGPQSFEENDDFFEQELRRANEEMMREHYTSALQSLNTLIQKYPNKPKAFLAKAQTLDRYAEKQKSNRILMESIKIYKIYLDFNSNIFNDSEFRQVAERSLNRIRFSGQLQQALPIHDLLIKRFPNDPKVFNDCAVTYLILNRLSDAKVILEKTLKKWPNDGYALVHYGFVIKQLDHDYEKAAEYLSRGIESKAKGTQDGRFYFQLGESYQRLGKISKALNIYKKGAEMKLFPSMYQRSLYNEPNLKAQPLWSMAETTYEKYFKILQQNWMAIRNEGLNILKKSGYFLQEAENLKSKGEWKQLELYSRGQRMKRNCMMAPITCGIIEQFPAARDCKRGQVKFSVMEGGTHVWPHCGPTNCRLRAHLGLAVPEGTRIRVADKERFWAEGKFLIFDDSFEHEVWHEGQGLRLILIVDIWHPDLTGQQRRLLHPI